MPHINYSLDRTVDTFVVYGNEVLLRMHEKHHKWLAPGGHIEPGEDSNTAALREVREESGLEVQLYHPNFDPYESPGFRELVPPFFLNRHRINEVHEHSSDIYLAISKINQLNIPEGREKAECRWFSSEEIEDPRYDIPEHIRRYARVALEEIGKLSK